MTNNNIKIDTQVVENKIKKLEDYYSEIERIVNNIESNVSAGWGSDVAKETVTASLETVKTDNLAAMRKSSTSLIDNANRYVSTVENINSGVRG